MGVARLLPPFVGGLGCCPLGVHDEPREEVPEVEDIGEDDPSWMGGLLEATARETEAELELLLGTVDKCDVVDKSEK